MYADFLIRVFVAKKLAADAQIIIDCLSHQPPSINYQRIPRSNPNFYQLLFANASAGDVAGLDPWLAASVC